MCMDVNNRAPVKANPEELTGDIGRHWRLNQTKPDKFPSERVLNMIPLLFIYLHYYEYDKLVPNSFMQDRYKITSLKPKRSNAFHITSTSALYCPEFGGYCPNIIVGNMFAFVFSSNSKMRLVVSVPIQTH